MAEHIHIGEPANFSDERRVRWALVFTAGFMAAEVVGGILSGSLALLADAGHMLTDAFSLVLALIAFRLSRRQPDEAKTFGYYRAQVLAAFTNGLVLLAVSAWIVYEAVLRLLQPTEILGGTMLVIAIIGLLVNLAGLLVLRGGSGDNLNLRGALLHVLSDTLGSVAVIIAAGIIMATGWYPIDPILSLVVVALIVVSAWKIVRQSAHVLMEGAPMDFDVAGISQGLQEAIPQVLDVHHVHAWYLTQDMPPLVTLHVSLADKADSDEVTRLVQEYLKEKHDVDHATVQTEFERCTDQKCGR